MAQHLIGRAAWGLAIGWLLLSGMWALAARIEPDNPGLSNAPCPPPGTGLADDLRLVVMTLAGRPPALRDWADLCFYQERNRAITAGNQPPKVVFLGDSITQYWGAADPGLFSDGRLNSGIAGQGSAQVLLRMVPDALALKPKVIHLLVGANDVRGIPGPSRQEDYRNNIRAMITLAQDAGVIVVLGLIPPATGKAEDEARGTTAGIKALNSWLTDLAREKNLVLADYWTVMSGPDGLPRTGLTEDGTHPSAQGYAAMKQVTLSALTEAERRLAAQPR